MGEVSRGPENCLLETNYTGKLNPRGSFGKLYLSSRYKEEEKKKGKRDELCTEHKDKLYFKMNY